jgi:DNA-binding transcriptional LysR family regulator
MLKNAPPEIDTRMMRVIYHLLNECNVSRAAAMVDMSQPAASQYLRRWRAITGDQLLVRSGSRMVRTEQGDQVLNKIALVLAELEGLTDTKTHFDAARSRRKLSVFTANSLGPFFVPRLVEAVRQAAPHVQLDLRPIMPEAQLVHELQAGGIDVAIGNWPTPPVHMRYSKLFRSRIACLVRAGHPLAGQTRVSLSDYLAMDHLSPTPASSMTISPVDARLAEIGVRRRIAVAIPEFSMASQVLASNDLVFTTAQALAAQMAQQHGFSMLSAPEELGEMTFYMLWHERLHHSAYGQWLRHLVKSVSEELRA